LSNSPLFIGLEILTKTIFFSQFVSTILALKRSSLCVSRFEDTAFAFLSDPCIAK
jgi:hypothetical protein